MDTAPVVTAKLPVSRRDQMWDAMQLVLNGFDVDRNGRRGRRDRLMGNRSSRWRSAGSRWW